MGRAGRLVFPSLLRQLIKMSDLRQSSAVHGPTSSTARSGSLFAARLYRPCGKRSGKQWPSPPFFCETGLAAGLAVFGESTSLARAPGRDEAERSTSQ